MGGVPKAPNILRCGPLMRMKDPLGRTRGPLCSARGQADTPPQVHGEAEGPLGQAKGPPSPPPPPVPMGRPRTPGEAKAAAPSAALA